jgi:hypothetical protein
MPWFTIDDSFHSHPKTLGVSFEAIGVWTKCGAWCSEHLTDGAVPSALLRAWSVREEAVSELVSAGLWDVDDGGYQFHDWLEYQQSRDEVQSKRAKAKERMSRARSRKVRANKRRTPEEPDPNKPRSSHNPSPSPSPILKERETRAPESFKPPDLHTASLRIGKHYQELHDAEQEGSQNPRPYDEQRICSTDFKQFSKLAELVKTEAARSGIGARQIFAAAAQAFLRDPRQQAKGFVLEFFVRDFTRYVDRSDLEAAS